MQFFEAIFSFFGKAVAFILTVLGFTQSLETRSRSHTEEFLSNYNITPPMSKSRKEESKNDQNQQKKEAKKVASKTKDLIAEVKKEEKS